MASFKQYTASGGASEAFSIPSFTSDEIKVRVDGVLKTATTHYNITNYTTNGGTVTWTSGNVPSSGTVYIYRDTKILNNASSDVEGKATYGTGVIYKNDLNDNQKQVLRALQEKDDQLIQSWDLASGAVETSSIKDGTIVDADINASANIQGSKLLNDSVGLEKLGNGALPTDITVSTQNIVNGTIIDADINSGASIAVNKLADGSARQILQTASNGSDVEWTSNVDIPGTLEVTGAVDFDNNLNVDGTLTVDGVSTLTGNVTVGGTVDGRDVAADGSKLDGIETAATADQTNAEIRAAVEAATDSNVFTDADHSKLDGVDTGATDDQTAAEIKALIATSPLDASHLAPNSVDSSELVDGSVDHSHLSNDCVDGDNIQDDVVNSEHIAAGALDNEHYATGSITSDKLNAATVVTASEQGSATANDTSFFTTSAADARYFNISTTETIKDGDTFPDNDTTIATTAAINDRIIDLVDDVGGFVPIANETSFPTANPDVNNGAGTLVSIQALASNLTSNGSGVATIANGAGSGNTVTINGLANSTTYASTFGMIVETTTTLHTYTFHRLVPKATEVTTVSGSIANINTVAGSIANVNTVASDLNEATSEIDTVATNITNVNNVGGSIANVNTVASNISTVNDFAARYRVSSTAPTSSLDEGDLYFDTTGNELKVYNGSAWQGGVTATGNLVSKAGDQMTGNLTFTGSQTVDGRDLSVDGAKLDGIEAGATGDQTNAEIRAAVEAASDSNVFTDADHSKLDAVAASANNYSISSDLLDEDDMASDSATKVPSQQSVKAYVDAQTNADTVDNLHAASFLRSDADDSFSGKLTSTYSSDEKIVLSGSNNPYIRWQEGTTNKAYLQYSSGVFYIVNQNDGSQLRLSDSLIFTPDDGSNQYTVWHAGNDGAGSGLDADTVDGVGSGSFLRSDASDSFSGLLTSTNTNNEKIVLSGSNDPYIRFQEGTTNKAYLEWNSAGYIRLFNQEDSSSILIRDSLTFSPDNSNFHAIWHAGNDGSGSGLDADTLDGVQGANFVRSDTNDTLAGTYTIEGTGNSRIILNSTNGGDSRLYFHESGTDRGYLGWSASNNGYWLWNNEQTTGILLNSVIQWYDGSAYKHMIHQGNVGSSGALSSSNVYMNTLYATNTSVGMYNYGWIYFEGTTDGLYWNGGSAHGWHIYPNNDGYMYMRSGNSSMSGIIMSTSGTTRGYFYANSSNEIGILDYAGNWALRTNRQSGECYLFDSHFFTDTNNTYDLGTTGTRWRNGYFGTSVYDSKGELRNIPLNPASGSTSTTYTLTSSDAGKCIVAGTTVIIPNGTIGGGDAVTIVNNTASNITLTNQVTNLYNAAGGSTPTTLAARGVATILFMSGGTTAYISGSGLS